MNHADMMKDFKIRFWVSLGVTIPILVLSPLIQSFFGFSLEFPGEKYILFGLSSFVFFYGGWPFFRGVSHEFMKKQPGMMTLIALAITVAYTYSSLVVFGLEGEIFFWELVTLIDIMLLGHWIEMRSVMGASHALEELSKLMPAEAHIIARDGSIRDVKIEELKKGDRVLVRPGEKIPADGKVIEGESEINESMITGESKPVSKKKDDRVIGGSINSAGSLTVEVTRIGEESYLSQVVELVKKASESKSRAQDLANKAAFWLTITAIVAGAITLVSWLLYDARFDFILERVVTVMVITCPHALGLAVPLVIAMITTLSAKNGILIRNRTSFESGRRLHTVVFGKTGTLTKGEFGVTDIVPLGDWNEEELLRRTASLEAHSEHTIAQGIVKKAREKNMELYMTENFEAIPGKGAKAKIEGNELYIGNRRILEIVGITQDEVEKRIDEIASQGKTIVLVTTKDKIQGIIGLADIIRDESREAIERLKKFHIADVVLVNNDPRTVVDVISLSRITYRKTAQNLAWATGYNIFAIPLAAGVLSNYGIILPPAVGAIIMSVSTIIVALNARLISYKKV
ncbi:MAG: heavy metal translocating P-type ATPase [Candidatus Jettenia caeni]|nr:MAG: heavy metal translocating P-type ATPase [Candidatus Jettenia caeni]